MIISKQKINRSNFLKSKLLPANYFKYTFLCLVFLLILIKNVGSVIIIGTIFNSLKNEGLSGGGSTDCLDLQTLFLCCDNRCSLSFSELGNVVSLLQ